jgi:hypothetical protein
MLERGPEPFFGLTVGRRSDPPTVGIAGVETPPEVILGRATPLVVSVRQGSREESRGTVRVSEEGRVLGRTEFALHGAGASARVSVPITLLERGKRFLSVEILDVADDPVRENKERLVAVVAPSSAAAAQAVLAEQGLQSWQVGTIEQGRGEATCEVVR